VGQKGPLLNLGARPMGRKARRSHPWPLGVRPKGRPLDLAGSISGAKRSALLAPTSMSG